jgi:GNAT superfamily N-acetyltransferase
VRPASAADAAAVAELLTQLGYRCAAAQAGARLEALARRPEQRVAVAERGGEVLGVVAACWSEALELAAPYGRVTALCVRAGYRGQGIGLHLLRFAERWLADCGVSACVVHSADHRRDAHRFYARNGYAATGIRLVKAIGRAPEHAAVIAPPPAPSES